MRFLSVEIVQSRSECRQQRHVKLDNSRTKHEMESSVLEGVKGDLQCPNCLGFFSDPVSLNCGHNFCRNCVTNYVQANPKAVREKVFLCSVCRENTPVPRPNQPVSKWGQQLIPSFTIRKLVDQLTRSATIGVASTTEDQDEGNCSLCGNIENTTWCPDCEIMLCRRCSEKHKKENTAHHIVSDKERHDRSEKMQCPLHNELVTFHCKHCNKGICNTCSSRHHSGHQKILLKERIREMKQAILQNEEKIRVKVEKKQNDLEGRKSNIQFIESRQSVAVSRIQDMKANFIRLVDQKFQRDVDEINRISDDAKCHEKSGIEMIEMNLHAFQRNLAMAREIQESENYKKIKAVHEVCEKGLLVLETVQNKLPNATFLDLVYNLDLDAAQKMVSELGRISVTFDDEDEEQCTYDTSVTSSGPVLVSEMTTLLPKDGIIPGLRGIVVMTVGDFTAIVVTDYMNNKVKCFYSNSSSASQGKSQSVCMMKNAPWGIAKLKDNRVLVSVPYCMELVLFDVRPELVSLSETATQERYWSLEMMDDGRVLAVADGGLFGMVGWSKRPGRVDIFEVDGTKVTMLQTIKTRHLGFRSPFSLTVYTYDYDDDVIVTDAVDNTVTCMTQFGHIKWTYSPPPWAKFKPRGVATTQRGDVVVVDGASHRIIVLTRSGKYKSDFLTPADTEFIDPNCVHYDDSGCLYVTDRDRILIYKV